MGEAIGLRQNQLYLAWNKVLGDGNWVEQQGAYKAPAASWQALVAQDRRQRPAQANSNIEKCRGHSVAVGE